MTNLLKETLEYLAEYGKEPSDVLWVGVRRSALPQPHGTWAQFEKLADIDYDSGYGGNEIAEGLVVVGDDWWLERGEYDGSEWWEFKTIPRAPMVPTDLRPEDLRSR
jgi:hypothetical protein